MVTDWPWPWWHYHLLTLAVRSCGCSEQYLATAARTSSTTLQQGAQGSRLSEQLEQVVTRPSYWQHRRRWPERWPLAGQK